MAHVHEHEVDENAGAEQRKAIWRTFWILLILTAVEFLIAFTLEAGPLKTAIFVGMTIVKAFYIVGEFMHLKHEVKSLIWAILIPCIFVVWLLIALMREGGSIFDLR
ncbi:cytochrome C oxidase subunit IV family protein [Runella salmonicolor]|jgi:cytochrome c oxidase subunit IV|uniref:Cytochrome C oxidase subunit IV family protein n=1 Tax=Runella salmonicolor TaxID=2950278 RepID=A0ABT1FI40_9BACT|nr:cytochrome C oxidase subunit IV family protein [Runella salmonicolor]MCP1381420.1 cytochrome C oxidase subunit IV family protein [Runella salmonicolor]